MSKFTTIINGQTIPKGVDDYLAEVQGTVDSIVAAAPEALDTLNELAAALNDDPDFAGTVATQLGTIESDLDSKASTGKAIAMAIVFGG